jgi:fibronectin-binding autotransporter adhesin
MAQRWLVSTGDIEVAARWNGGTLPATYDDLYANGFTGTISASRTALSWRTTAGTTAVAGGGFTCNVAGTSIGGNIIAGTTVPLALNNTTGTITLTGDVIASTTNAVATVVKTLAGSISHVGNSTGGSGGTNAIGIQVNGGNFSGVGNYTAGSSSNSWGLQLAAANTANTVAGNALGGASTSAAGVLVQTVNTSLTLTGNCTAATSTALWITGAGSTVTISGDVTGGTGTAARGVDNAAASTVTIGGNATGGTNATITATCFGAYNQSSGLVTVQGHTIGAPSGGVAVGVFGSLASNTTVGSVRTSTTGIAGIAGKVLVASHATSTLEAADVSLAIQTYRAGGGRPSNPFLSQVIG